MQVFFSETHKRHQPRHEFIGGALVPAFDRPERAEQIAGALQQTGLFKFDQPTDLGMVPIRAIHEQDYLDFLSTAFKSWQAAGLEGSPMASNVAGSPKGPRPEYIEGVIGYYANSCETTIDDGTWEGAYASAQSAINAARYVTTGQGRSAFALCRPPGHHCEATRFGGYCYLNNAAIAAQYLRDHGTAKTAILDIDFHHGNGTQAIFYDRADVFYGSVHGDPLLTYPFYKGYSNETGTGVGAETTMNLPLGADAGNDEWLAAITALLGAIDSFGADTIVVSLGVDPHHSDPQSNFQVTTDGFSRAGHLIANAGKQTVIIMEGGYSADAIGPCVAAFLQALDDTWP